MLSHNNAILPPRIQRMELELLQTISVLFATHLMILFPENEIKNNRDVEGKNPLLCVGTAIKEIFKFQYL